MTTCPNATAPIDITGGKVLAYCDLKCDYAFSYPISSITASNHVDNLSFKFDKSVNPPVRYNADNYEVSEARLYSPSLHTYNGSKAKAELIIHHINTYGRGVLLVCIPILVVQNSTSSTVAMFDTILSQCAKTVPTAGQQTIVTANTFTLNTFVPTKTFYSYTATLPYAPCGSAAHYVVFIPDNAASTASMSSDAYTALTKLIKPHAYTVQKNDKINLFYNKVGAKRMETNKGDMNVYIECNPTGDDGEVIVPNNRTSVQMFNTSGLKNMLQNGLFQAIAGVLVIVLMMKICTLLLNKMTGKTVVITRGVLQNAQGVLPNVVKISD